MGIAQFFLSALDAILGDTQTSRAVAAIISLVQREFKNPETGINGERVGLADVMVGTVAFAILQRWGAERTQKELERSGVQTVVWDIVVVADAIGTIQEAAANHYQQQYRLTQEARSNERPITARQASFMSASGNGNTFEGIGDGRSFITTSSFDPAGGRPQSRGTEAFKDYVANQLSPGTIVALSVESLSQDIVTLQIRGDRDAELEPPAGFLLVSRQKISPGHLIFIFRRRSKRLREVNFNVGEDETDPRIWMIDAEADVAALEQPRERVDITDRWLVPSLEASPTKTDAMEYRNHGGTLLKGSSFQSPVRANQKRLRSPLASHTDLPSNPISRDTVHDETAAMKAEFDSSAENAQIEQQTPVRKSMRNSKSVKSLVNFWSRDRPVRDKGQNDGQNFEQIRDNDGAREQGLESQEQQRPINHRRIPSDIHMRRPPLTEAALASYQPIRGLLRRRSSLSSVTTAASETSTTMVLYQGSPEEETIRTQLYRHGKLHGCFPVQPLTTSLARFAKFAVAAYGSTFLRLTNSWEEDTILPSINDDLPQHQFFSTYTKLPSHSILLSSYIDPQGGSSPASHDPDHGLPLVHYISVDHESKAVVLTCRGTLGFEDVLTDMVGDYDDIKWLGETHRVHKGIYASARRLLTIRGGKVLATMKAALEEFEDYGLIFCGHSLGGAVAAVLAVILAEKSTKSAGGTASYCTSGRVIGNPSTAFPANRPMHVYAYGPAASFSPSLQQTTRGLITTVLHGQDFVPYLSLGHLRDFQAMALAFKTDSHNAKSEVLRRVRDGILQSFRDRSGLAFSQQSQFSASDEWGQNDEDVKDHWPWIALESLRASMLAEKLVPPGEIFTIESQPVLQRHAFVEASSPSKDGGKDGGVKVDTRSYRPATHIKFGHVEDAETRYNEMRFGASMFADHFPGRYEKTLAALGRGLGGG